MKFKEAKRSRRDLSTYLHTHTYIPHISSSLPFSFLHIPPFPFAFARCMAGWLFLASFLAISSLPYSQNFFPYLRTSTVSCCATTPQVPSNFPPRGITAAGGKKKSTMLLVRPRKLLPRNSRWNTIHAH